MPYYDIQEIKRRLPLNELLVKLSLFEKVPRNGTYPCPIHQERNGKSFSLFEKKGEPLFKCHGKCGFRGGDGVTLIKQLHNCDKQAAIAHYAELAGVSPDTRRIATRRLSLSPVRSPRHGTEFSHNPIPDGIRKIYEEGIRYLQGSVEDRHEIALLRGWPIQLVDFLSWNEGISMPLCYGKRCIAFPVFSPIPKYQMVGFHARLAPLSASERPSWVYMPNQKVGGQRTAALPYIIGGSDFQSARLLVIQGGQWDTLTFGYAAGWIGDGLSLPKGVCLLGMRGDTSEKVFLNAYSSIWPAKPTVILMPDADESGSKWEDGDDSFAERLRGKGARVVIVHNSPYKDFNELYRTRGCSREDIALLISQHGFSIGLGVAA